jgi:hypothetical protein
VVRSRAVFVSGNEIAGSREIVHALIEQSLRRFVWLFVSLEMSTIVLIGTLVIWGGEFGQLPISQSKNGRDHGRQGFTIWMAGGGVRAGHIHAATDEFGYAAVENRVSVPDLHATILHLLGTDHRELTFPRNGLDERLTGVYEPRIVKEIMA